MSLTVNIKQAIDFTQRCFAEKLTPMIWGDPGIGKSAIAHFIAKKYNLKMIDVRLSTYDTVDLNGFPKLDGDIAYYVPMSTFPTSKRGLPLDDNGNEMNGWLLFLDEFSSAAPAVESAAYKLVLDRQVGEYDLHESCYIMAAGNLSTSGAIARKSGTAMQTRMIHMKLLPLVKEWLVWADGAGIDHRVKAFIAQSPSALNNFKVDHNDFTFACQRTWEFLSRLSKKIKTEDLQEYLPLLAGAVSEASAQMFILYTEVYTQVPSYEDILKKPNSTDIPSEPAAKFAVCHMIGEYLKAEETEVETILKYVTRMGAEWQTIALQGALRRDNTLRRVKSFNSWMTNTGIKML
jgi:hypothetical protein